MMHGASPQWDLFLGAVKDSEGALVVPVSRAKAYKRAKATRTLTIVPSPRAGALTEANAPIATADSSSEVLGAHSAPAPAQPPGESAGSHPQEYRPWQQQPTMGSLPAVLVGGVGGGANVTKIGDEHISFDPMAEPSIAPVPPPPAGPPPSGAGGSSCADVSAAGVSSTTGSSVADASSSTDGGACNGAATDGGGGVGAIPHLGLAACPSLRSSATGAIEKLPLTPRFSEPGCMSRTLGGSHARRSIRFLPAQDPRRARELEMIELAQAYEDYSSAEAHHRRLSLAASHAGSVTSRAGVSIGGIPMGGQAAPLETMRSEVWP